MFYTNGIIKLLGYPIGRHITKFTVYYKTISDLFNDLYATPILNSDSGQGYMRWAIWLKEFCFLLFFFMLTILSYDMPSVLK